MADIDAAAGPADSLCSDQSAFAAFPVLDVNPENSLLVIPDEFIVLDISLFLQNAAQVGLHTGSGNIHLVKPRLLRIANTVEEVAYRIRYHHFSDLLLRSYQLALTTPGSSPLSAMFRKQIRQIPNLRM